MPPTKGFQANKATKQQKAAKVAAIIASTVVIVISSLMYCCIIFSFFKELPIGTVEVPPLVKVAGSWALYEVPFNPTPAPQEDARASFRLNSR